MGLLSRLSVAVLALPLALSACADGTLATKSQLKPVEPAYPMRWDHRPEAKDWNKTAFAALDSHGTALFTTVPRDINEWCPGYETASEEDRKAFWVGLISTLAKHESTWNPRAVGGGGLWFGLVQIAPSTARLYRCEAKSGAALKDGSANVSCAIRIMNRTVPRDGVVSKNMRGVAADWGPFHSSKKRNDMKAWISAQPYCQPKKPSVMSFLKPKG